MSLKGKRPSRSRSVLSSRLSNIYNQKRRKFQLLLCPHCDQTLMPKTYNRHKRLNYNNVEDTWARVDQSKDFEDANVVGENEG